MQRTEPPCDFESLARSSIVGSASAIKMGHVVERTLRISNDARIRGDLDTVTGIARRPLYGRELRESVVRRVTRGC